jgi:hypothetical protein
VLARCCWVLSKCEPAVRAPLAERPQAVVSESHFRLKLRLGISRNQDRSIVVRARGSRFAQAVFAIGCRAAQQTGHHCTNWRSATNHRSHPQNISFIPRRTQSSSSREHRVRPSKPFSSPWSHSAVPPPHSGAPSRLRPLDHPESSPGTGRRSDAHQAYLCLGQVRRRLDLVKDWVLKQQMRLAKGLDNCPDLCL